MGSVLNDLESFKTDLNRYFLFFDRINLDFKAEVLSSHTKLTSSLILNFLLLKLTKATW